MFLKFMSKIKKENSKKPTKLASKKEAILKVEEKVKRIKEADVKSTSSKGKKPASAKKIEDTGSVEFQVKNFSAKIKTLTKHLREHRHDFDSRRGLLIMVGKRRRLLNYMKKSDLEKYEKFIKELKLKA